MGVGSTSRSADAAYGLAQVAEKLIFKLMATKGLLPNTFHVATDDDPSSFAKKLRFDDDDDKLQQLLKFCQTLQQIVENFCARKRIALHDTTGGTDLFVNLVRLLEAHNVEVLFGEEHIRSLKTTISTLQECMDSEKLTAEANNEEEHDERFVYQQMMRRCIERASQSTNSGSNATQNNQSVESRKREATSPQKLQKRKKKS